MQMKKQAREVEYLPRDTQHVRSRHTVGALAHDTSL